jgi:hypothetical protein
VPRNAARVPAATACRWTLCQMAADPSDPCGMGWPTNTERTDACAGRSRSIYAARTRATGSSNGNAAFVVTGHHRPGPLFGREPGHVTVRWTMTWATSGVRACLWSSVLACMGCGSRPAATPEAQATSSDDAAASGEVAGTNEDSVTYTHGVDTCCGQGHGLSCCTADAGLLGFALDGSVFGAGSGRTEANCFQYGGVSGACYNQDSTFEAKNSCAICCAGLTHVSPLVVNDGDAGQACMLAGPPSAFTCVPCGNGTCDPDENHCTCPADCP